MESKKIVNMDDNISKVIEQSLIEISPIIEYITSIIELNPQDSRKIRLTVEIEFTESEISSIIWLNDYLKPIVKNNQK